jgi:hypothetical protein
MFLKKRERVRLNPSQAVAPSTPLLKIPVSNPSVLQVSYKCLVPSCCPNQPIKVL